MLETEALPIKYDESLETALSRIGRLLCLSDCGAVELLPPYRREERNESRGLNNNKGRQWRRSMPPSEVEMGNSSS